MRILQTSAEHCAPVPLAETMLAGWLLAQAGLAVPEGVLTVAPVRKADVLTVARTGAGVAPDRHGPTGTLGAGRAMLVVLADGPDGRRLVVRGPAGRSDRLRTT